MGTPTCYFPSLGPVQKLLFFPSSAAVLLMAEKALKVHATRHPDLVFAPLLLSAFDPLPTQTLLLSLICSRANHGRRY